MIYSAFPGCLLCVKTDILLYFTLLYSMSCPPRVYSREQRKQMFKSPAERREFYKRAMAWAMAMTASSRDEEKQVTTNTSPKPETIPEPVPSREAITKASLH